jgi:hypothetical protein
VSEEAGNAQANVTQEVNGDFRAMCNPHSNLGDAPGAVGFLARQKRPLVEELNSCEELHPSTEPVVPPTGKQPQMENM